jgi:hypothetical protein
VFTAFTFLAPMMQELAGFSPSAVSWEHQQQHNQRGEDKLQRGDGAMLIGQFAAPYVADQTGR